MGFIECTACHIAVKAALAITGAGDASKAADAIIAGLDHVGIHIPGEDIIKAITEFGNNPDKICKAIKIC